MTVCDCCEELLDGDKADDTCVYRYEIEEGRWRGFTMDKNVDFEHWKTPLECRYRKANLKRPSSTSFAILGRVNSSAVCFTYRRQAMGALFASNYQLPPGQFNMRRYRGLRSTSFAPPNKTPEAHVFCSKEQKQAQTDHRLYCRKNWTPFQHFFLVLSFHFWLSLLMSGPSVTVTVLSWVTRPLKMIIVLSQISHG